MYFFSRKVYFQEEYYQYPIRFKRSKRRSMTSNYKLSIKAKNSYSCIYCKKKFSKERSQKLSIEHLIPIIRGGNERKYNLSCSCIKCNEDKDIMTHLEYVKYLGIEDPLNYSALRQKIQKSEKSLITDQKILKQKKILREIGMPNLIFYLYQPKRQINPNQTTLEFSQANQLELF